MDRIPDFTDSELWVIRTTLKERYGKDPELEIADAEIRLSPAARSLTECPVVLWSERGSNLVVFKSGEREFRAQFYYRGYQQYGTGRSNYSDLTECVTTLLQVQADHERQENRD